MTVGTGAVVGVGAGTEMLWCLQNGAKEVVGIDIAEQDPAALLMAGEQLNLDIKDRFSMHRLPIEEAESLDRQFDLVLSNNVFEHLPDVGAALSVCTRLVRPTHGRIAIFADPLFYSSAGSHLELDPWEHVWGSPEDMRNRMIETVPALQSMSWEEYLFQTITLNRMRVGELIEAVADCGLVVLNVRIVRDRNLAELPEFGKRMPDISTTDLAIEGIGLELVRLEESGVDPEALATSTEERVIAQNRAALMNEIEQHKLHVEALEGNVEALEGKVETLEANIVERDTLIRSVENSVSFRLGRGLTAPLRWLRNREPDK